MEEDQQSKTPEPTSEDSFSLDFDALKGNVRYVTIDGANYDIYRATQLGMRTCERLMPVTEQFAASAKNNDYDSMISATKDICAAIIPSMPPEKVEDMTMEALSSIFNYFNSGAVQAMPQASPTS